MNDERAKIQINSKISSNLNHDIYKTGFSDSKVTHSLFKANKFPNTESLQNFESKPQRLGRFSDKHFLQNANKAEAVEKLTGDLTERSVHFDLDKNYKISFSESDGESKIGSSDLSEDIEYNFIKDVKISMKEKPTPEDTEKAPSSTLLFKSNTENFNKNPFQTEYGKSTILQPLKKTGYMQFETNGAKFGENLGKVDNHFSNESSQDKFPSQGTVKSLQNRFSALTNPFKKLPPLGSKANEQKSIDIDNSKDQKPNSSKSFEDKLKKLSEKLNTGFTEPSRLTNIRQKSTSNDGESLQNDLIRKTFLKVDDDKIVKDENTHSLLRKFEVGSGKIPEIKSAVEMLGDHAIDEQISGISLSYCNPEGKSEPKSDVQIREVRQTAQMRRNLFFTKMTEAVKAKPLSIDTDSETDSLKKNKRSHKIILADDMNILKPKHSEHSEKSLKEPIKAFPLESDDSTALDISVNLSNSEGHSKMSNIKCKDDLIDFSKDISDILDNDIISEKSFVKLMIPGNLDAKIIEDDSKIVQSLPKSPGKIVDVEKLDKSNEISKTSSDTSVESQIQSNMHNISKKDGNDMSIKQFLDDVDHDIIEFPLEKSELKIDSVAVRQCAKSSQTDAEDKKIALEKFTQTIDVPNFLVSCQMHVVFLKIMPNLILFSIFP